MSVDDLPKLRRFTIKGKLETLYLIKVSDSKEAMIEASIILRNWGYNACVAQQIITDKEGRTQKFDKWELWSDKDVYEFLASFI